MTETQTNKGKARGRKLSHKERKAAQAAAARRARLQWWIIGAVLAIAVIVTIILISVYTEGSLPSQQQGF
jgi:type VI protein secretion system component VasF